MLRFWVLFADNTWFALAGLTVLLVILLASGILLLSFGAWDLIHDFRNFLRDRLHKDSHA